MTEATMSAVSILKSRLKAAGINTFVTAAAAVTLLFPAFHGVLNLATSWSHSECGKLHAAHET